MNCRAERGTSTKHAGFMPACFGFCTTLGLERQSELHLNDARLPRSGDLTESRCRVAVLNGHVLSLIQRVRQIGFEFKAAAFRKVEPFTDRKIEIR